MARGWGLGVAVAAALGLGATGASAAANRAWVSGHGVDAADCGAPTSPCRSLQYAHDHAVVAGGEIDILDPAGYGAITITKGISIVNDGVGTAGVQATSGAAITITAGVGDAVYLRGLNIDGVQDAGADGVVFNAGGRLTMIGCVVRHFSNDGILLQPTAGNVSIIIANTWTMENGAAGFEYNPPSGTPFTDITLDQVTADANVNGLNVDTTHDFGSTVIAAHAIRADQNSGDGARLDGNPSSTLQFDSDMSYYTRNTQGLRALGAAIVYLSRSEFAENQGYDVINTASYVYTFKDNRMLDGVSGPALMVVAPD